MSHEQRNMMAKTVFDLANLVSIARVFGQFVSSQAFSIKVFITTLREPQHDIYDTTVLAAGLPGLAPCSSTGESGTDRSR